MFFNNQISEKIGTVWRRTFNYNIQSSMKRSADYEQQGYQVINLIRYKNIVERIYKNTIF